MSESKRETERVAVQAETAQDVSLQGLRTGVSDFQKNLLAPLGTPRDAFWTLSHVKTEPVGITAGLNGATPAGVTPKHGPWERVALTSDCLL